MGWVDLLEQGDRGGSLQWGPCFWGSRPTGLWGVDGMGLLVMAGLVISMMPLR